MEVLNSLWHAILAFLPNLLSAAIIFIVGYVIIRLLQAIIHKWLKKRVNVSFHAFIQSSVRIFLWVFLMLCVAGALGIDTTSFITALGAAGLAVGLALQNSLSNLASGIMILATKSFQVGDFIEVEGVSGTVRRVDLMFTSMDTLDNKQIIIPNSKLTADVIINYTKNDIRRVDLVYGISYESDMEKAREILHAICENCEHVLSDPAPQIVVNGYEDSAVHLGVKVWCDKHDYWNVLFAINEKVKAAFDEGGITIPFPQVDVHTKS